MKTAVTVACLNMDYEISMFDLHKYESCVKSTVKIASPPHLFLQLDVVLAGYLGILVPLPKIFQLIPQVVH